MEHGAEFWFCHVIIGTCGGASGDHYAAVQSAGIGDPLPDRDTVRYPVEAKFGS